MEKRELIFTFLILFLVLLLLYQIDLKSEKEIDADQTTNELIDKINNSIPGFENIIKKPPVQQYSP